MQPKIVRFLLALCGLLIAAGVCTADPTEQDGKVEALLQKLTLEQKIALLGGEDAFFTRSAPAIDLPRLKMSDGPLGVRTWGESTAYAGGVALAASWDVALARRIGVSLGRDARARGVNFLLGPAVNIYRSPLNGRNFEYFGEDPYLAARLAVNYIEGVQSQDVAATVKHFAANNSEYDRHNIDSRIGEQALREIYLPAFEAAVTEARVGAVMNSYNLLNSEHATQNHFLNLDVLKGEWGFRGLLMSDWAATYDGVAAAQNGLDLEMPSAKFMNAATLLPAIRAGRIAPEVIDDKVRRLLRTAVRFHFLDRPQLDPAIPLYDQRSRQVALESAQESMVLLKNDGHLLPLNPAKLRSVALIGPDAYPAIPGGGGSSDVSAFAPVSLLTGFSDALAGKAVVRSSPGLRDLHEIFKTSRWVQDAAGTKPGLKVEEFPTTSLSGEPRLSVSPFLDQWANPTPPAAARAKVAERFSGYFIPPRSGSYLFVAAGVGHDLYELRVNRKSVLERRVPERQAPVAAEVELKEGAPAEIQFTYFPGASRTTVGLGVVPADDVVDPAVRAMAAAADVAVVSVGFDKKSEAEGYDRSFRLPFGQDALIRAVRAANPRTIVILTAGGGVDATRWIDRVPVLVHAFYGGQEAGRAMAQALLGEINPSGHLPFSFERRLEDNPAAPNYAETPGGNRVEYAEGVFLGYRYYASAKVTPLFPFGFGLSYTTFGFSHLSVRVEGPGAATAAFEVTNTGGRAGAEIAQVYVGDPSARIRRPARELKGFARVILAPGQTERISVHLDRRAFSYWDVASHGWKMDPGRFAVSVGESSADLPLQAGVEMP